MRLVVWRIKSSWQRPSNVGRGNRESDVAEEKIRYMYYP